MSLQVKVVNALLTRDVGSISQMVYFSLLRILMSNCIWAIKNFVLLFIKMEGKSLNGTKHLDLIVLV
jgi:hypothetical protein